MKTDAALFLLRVTTGAMMIFGHGYGKVVRLFSGATSFPDPLGIGSTPSLALAAFAEFFCALAVIVGFKTRWAAIPVALTMLVAGLVHHAGDPFGDRELAFLYAAAFVALALAGGGRYSLDSVFGRRRRR